MENVASISLTGQKDRHIGTAINHIKAKYHIQIWLNLSEKVMDIRNKLNICDTDAILPAGLTGLGLFLQPGEVRGK